jgi:hypothetical protein
MFDWFSLATTGNLVWTEPQHIYVRHRNRLMRLATTLMHGWPKRRRWD